MTTRSARLVRARWPCFPRPLGSVTMATLHPEPSDRNRRQIAHKNTLLNPEDTSPISFFHVIGPYLGNAGISERTGGGPPHLIFGQRDRGTEDRGFHKETSVFFRYSEAPRTASTLDSATTAPWPLMMTALDLPRAAAIRRP